VVAQDGRDWTTPGAFEVSPDVYRIPLPLPNDGLRAVNVYAVADGQRVVLIDGGWALKESEELLARSLDTIGYGLEHISTFLVTHAHRDHYTQAIAVRRKFGARVGIGVGERFNIEPLAPPADPPELAQLRLLEAAGAAVVASELHRLRNRQPIDTRNWELPDEWLVDRRPVVLRRRTLEPIHTPGHTRGHMVFLDASAQVLFAGDHVLPDITPSIGFEQAPVASPLADYLTSLGLLREMPDAKLLPGHGEPIPSVHARVDQLLEHHARRVDASLAAIGKGANTAYQVAVSLDWTRRKRSFADLDPFNQMLAVLETAAHLEVLVERGHLTRPEQDGVVHYLT
jgi:glyoxylase-like metal-dependent hydrolase (beta-lactamase superfamily II)